MDSYNSDSRQAATKPDKVKPFTAENLMIPKHRFDCINLCLKDTKQALRDKTLEAEESRTRMSLLEKALLDAKVDTALAVHKARSLTAVKALIDFTDLRLGQDGDVPGLEAQILRIKESQNYLFENQESMMYVLLPVKSEDPLNKSITNYIKKQEKIK